MDKETFEKLLQWIEIKKEHYFELSLQHREHFVEGNRYLGKFIAYEEIEMKINKLLNKEI